MLSTFIPPTLYISTGKKIRFNAFHIPIPPSFHSSTSLTLPINTQTFPTPPGCRRRSVLSQNSTATSDWRPRSQRSTQPNVGKFCQGGAPCCSLKHIWKSLQRRPDATRKSSILAVVSGMHTFCSHDSTIHHYSTNFWDLHAQTIPQRVPGSLWCVCRSIRQDLSRRPQECDYMWSIGVRPCHDLEIMWF
jgi:hypothetical protein